MVIKEISKDAFLLPTFAGNAATQLIEEIQTISSVSPFRQMTTPRGFKIAVAMTNCGEMGWISDQQGYRYSQIDPVTQAPWPEMPDIYQQIAQQAAAQAGFDFEPDVCLINRYTPGLSMGRHRDVDEQDMTAPLVSISLGVAAVFEFGGLKRNDPVEKLLLQHGDVMVWGGQARQNYHGIKPIKLAHHSLTGQIRYNLTFRKAR